MVFSPTAFRKASSPYFHSFKEEPGHERSRQETPWHPKKFDMKAPLIFDGRNLFDPDFVRKQGFEYRAIGR